MKLDKNTRLDIEFNRNINKINELKKDRDNLISLNRYLKYKQNHKRERKINKIIRQIEYLRKRQISIKNQLNCVL